MHQRHVRQCQGCNHAFAELEVASAHICPRCGSEHTNVVSQEPTMEAALEKARQICQRR
ncbi:MAG: hypothetical protein JRH20_27585 [Deltaproteobacteria bacterium]|nr:hypothetical protein [Deltaproteobacteria bacterium]